MTDCKSNERLTIYKNGGSQYFDRKGILKLFPMSVYHNGKSMANIFSMKGVVSLPGLHVTFDSLKECAMLVHYKDKVYKFKECAEGLYYYDTATSEPIKPKTNVISYSFLETVKDNKEYYTSQEIKGAELARKTQQEIG